MNYTDDHRRRVNRRLDRRNERRRRHREEVAQVLAEMRRGASLRRTHRPSRTIWQLSSGPFVPPTVADAVIRDKCVVGTGDCLFGSDELSQTFRFVED